MDIYWIENGERKGPLPVVEIISQMQLGQLSEDAKGWHEGCPKWIPVRDLPALTGYFSETRESEISAEEDDTTSPPGAMVKVVVVPPPWIRLIARILDILIVVFIITLAVPAFHIPFNESYLVFGALALLPVLILYDTLLISLFGTTPGKALLNINVLQTDEEKPGFIVSLIRAIYVYTLGCGLLQVPFMPILPLFSWYLTKKNGLAPWDIKLKLATFVSAQITAWRMLTCSWLSVMLLYGCNSNLSLWDPEIQKMFQEDPQGTQQASPAVPDPVSKNFESL